MNRDIKIPGTKSCRRLKCPAVGRPVQNRAYSGKSTAVAMKIQPAMTERWPGIFSFFLLLTFCSYFWLMVLITDFLFLLLMIIIIIFAIISNNDIIIMANNRTGGV